MLRRWDWRTVHAFGIQTARDIFIQKSSFKTRSDTQWAELRFWAEVNLDEDGHSKSLEEEDKKEEILYQLKYYDQVRQSTDHNGGCAHG